MTLGDLTSSARGFLGALSPAACAFRVRGADLQRWGGLCFSPLAGGLLLSALVSCFNSVVETNFFLLRVVLLSCLKSQEVSHMVVRAFLRFRCLTYSRAPLGVGHMVAFSPGRE